MKRKQMSKRAPWYTALIIVLSLTLCFTIFLVVYRFAFPASYFRTWAYIFVKADAIDGGMNPEECIVETESPVIELQPQSTSAEAVSEGIASLEKALSEYNEDVYDSVFEAEGAYIFNSNGEVIFAKNEHETLYPASMTKLLTAIVVCEHVDDLTEIFEIGELEGCYESGSVLMYLDPGDRMSYIDLLYCMLMVSYNDTATALAIQVGGSLEGFADMMNETAVKIGCVDSHFVTPHGLFDEEHYSSAYDMALIIRYAMSIDTIAEILSTKAYTALLYGASGRVYEKDVSSSNYFLNDVYDVPGFDYLGGKTGYILKARSCIATCFEKDGVTYYSAVLKALDASYMTSFLYRYTMEPYTLRSLAETEPVMKEYQLEYEAE